MDVKELKNYIYENNYCEQILESVGCHHIKYHSVGAYWTAGNPDGDNKGAIILYNNESLICLNKTRQMIKGNRQTDIIDLVCYVKDLTFPEGLKEICSEIGMSYYHDFEEDIPDSFKILKMLEDMDSNISEEKETPKLFDFQLKSSKFGIDVRIPCIKLSDNHPCKGCVWYDRNTDVLFCPFHKCVRYRKGE